MSSTRVLVAGVGNIFKADDGFGVAVARRLEGVDVPDGVVVADFGIRGIHLVYELMNGYDLLVLVDAVERGGAPGTLYVIEPDLDVEDGSEPPSMMDAHDLAPQSVLALVPDLGASVERVLVVGCETATVEDGIGLSDSVQASVEPAADLVLELLANEPTV